GDRHAALGVSGLRVVAEVVDQDRLVDATGHELLPSGWGLRARGQAGGFGCIAVETAPAARSAPCPAGRRVPPRRGVRLRHGPYNPRTFCLPEPMDLAPTAPLPDLAAIQALAADDMAGIDALIRRRLASDVVLINQVAEHIISSGGKRLRPMLVALAGRACGGHGPEHHQLAAIIEFIHTSTLLHDDVIDESDLRRGRSTANAIWGNAASVLVGDFLYSRSFQLMVELDRMQ